jgi:hypothetical protein
MTVKRWCRRRNRSIVFLWRRAVCDNQSTLCNLFYMHLYESCLKPTTLKMNLLMGSSAETWGFRGKKMLRQWQCLWYIHTSSGFLYKVHLTRSHEWAEPTWLRGSRTSGFPVHVKYIIWSIECTVRFQFCVFYLFHIYWLGPLILLGLFGQSSTCYF